MTRIALFSMLLLGLGLPLAGCDQTSIDIVPYVRYDLAGTTPPDAGGTTFIPGKPLVGMQIDRAGRPGINLLLTDPFDVLGAQMTKDTVQNQYNAAVPGNWSAYAGLNYIPRNLAVFDSFDGICGNQLMAGTLSANRYVPLATVLADDRLYINANLSTCSSYLALEAGTAGDCGGYHPTVVAMDVTYNILVAGRATGTYNNGVTADLDGGIAMNAPFPFLIAPK